MDDSIDYLRIIILLLLSAFFSGSETAFFSLSKIHVKKLEKSKNSSERRIFRLLKKPHELLIAILLGNTIVNVAASSAAAIIALNIAEKYFANSPYKPWILPIEMVIMTVTLLIVGEISPKLFAFSKAENFAKRSGIIIEILKIPLWPIIKILSFFSNSVSKKDKAELHDTSQLTSEDFQNLIASEEANHTLEESEKQIINGIFKFSSTEAKEIMVPRVDMKAVEITDSKEKIIKKINQSGHSRIPIFESSIDNILGFIYAKDLLLNPDKSISSLLRKPYFITENTNIQVLLNHFQTKRIHISIVVDEYGGTSGLVTLEDILEILVGEIFDEYDREPFLIKKVNDSEYIVSGMYLISDLNQKFRLDIDEEKHDNLASFLYDEFNKVPSKNEFIEYNNAKFTVTAIQKRRIHYAKITLPVITDTDE